MHFVLLLYGGRKGGRPIKNKSNKKIITSFFTSKKEEFRDSKNERQNKFSATIPAISRKHNTIINMPNKERGNTTVNNSATHCNNSTPLSSSSSFFLLCPMFSAYMLHGKKTNIDQCTVITSGEKKFNNDTNANVKAAISWNRSNNNDKNNNGQKLKLKKIHVSSNKIFDASSPSKNLFDASVSSKHYLTCPHHQRNYLMYLHHK